MQGKITSIWISFKTRLFWDFFRPFSGPIQTYFLQWSIYHGNLVVADLYLLWMTPSSFFLRLPTDSKRSASSNFTSLEQNKVRDIRQKGGHHPLTETRLEWQSGPFQLENRLGHSHSLCDVSCIDGFAATLFKWWLQQFHNVGGSLSFCYLSSLTTLFEWSPGSCPHMYCWWTILFLPTCLHMSRYRLYQFTNQQCYRFMYVDKMFILQNINCYIHELHWEI